ncbi:MAG: hypothetical protein M1376_20235 [Planctomycetes bacterium]|nr:hypothetical protein [Planctomycetota bacterium]
MNRKVGLLIVVVAIAVVLAGYVLLGRSHIPAPASGGQARKPVVDTDAQINTVMARLAEQSQLAASAPDPNKAARVAAKPAPDEQGELRDIDGYAAAERQKIEAWYAEQMAGLKAQLEQRVQTLSDKDKLAWLEFLERAKEARSNPGGRLETTAPGDPAGEYAAILARIKDPKQMTQQDFVNAQIGLARMRQDKLAAVQMEVDRRKALLASQKPPLPTAPTVPTKTTQKQAKPAANPTPKVEAIMAGADNRLSALIGDSFVSDGATVQGYRVKKIQADSVEFEKDGQTWVQKVN